MIPICLGSLYEYYCYSFHHSSFAPSRYGAAEADCCTAISLDPSYVKAYSRRGSARVKLNKIQEARKDFHHVLKLEPRNKQAEAEIKKIDQVGDVMVVSGAHNMLAR